MALINNGPNADEINKQIAALNYSPQGILAFPGSSVTSFIPGTGELTPQKFIVVTKEKHTIDGTFDVSVPNAFRSLTYPGALLRGNQKLVEGMPELVTVALAPRKITIDLPGLTGDNSIVPKTNDFAGVSPGINDLINQWLETKSSQYTIVANTHFRRNILYNENEMALQFGVDMSYLKGKLGFNFESVTKQENAAYLVMSRQIFFTVPIDPPVHSDGYVDQSVSWQNDLAGKIDEKSLPVYVLNVQYDCEIFGLLRSNISSSELKTHLDALWNTRRVSSPSRTTSRPRTSTSGLTAL